MTVRLARGEMTVTLALYGKSRRRQALLLLAAVVVVLIGALAALGPDDSGRAAVVDTGWRSPATQGDDAPHGTNQWVNASGVLALDTSAGTSGSNNAAHGLGHFGFTFDPEATVTGIEVRFNAWMRNPDNSSCRLDLRVWRASRGGGSTTSKWATERKAFTLTKHADDDVYQSVGGTTDLWGDTGWRLTDFSESNFALEIRFARPDGGCDTGGANGIAVDHIQVRVHYATPEPPPLPDLTVTKSATRDGLPVTSIADDEDFRWSWIIANEGEADADFSAGQVVLRDELPGGLTYSSPASTSAALSCAVVSGLLTCTTNKVTIAPGATLTVSVQAEPSTAGTFTNAVGGCTVDYSATNANGNVEESDETNNNCAAAVSVEVIEQTVLPTVRKEAHAEPVSNSKAQWTITIDQPTENWADQTVVITDAHDDIELIDPPPACSAEAAVITCTVGQNDITLTVARPITNATLTTGDLCNGGTIANHIATAETAAELELAITEGGTPVSIAVQDTTTCGSPSVTKSRVPGSEGPVTTPAEVAWQIRIANPVGGLDPVTVTVRDEGAVFVSDSGSPNFDEWCAVTIDPLFEVTCAIPLSEAATWNVKPAIAPELTCDGNDYVNTASHRVGETEAWTEAPGPEITLEGAESECPQEIRIIKRLVNVPDGRTIDPVDNLPSLTVPGGTYVSGPTDLGSNAFNWVYTVPPRYDGVVTESAVPGWEAVACQQVATDAYATFCNQPLANIGVTKLYAPNGGSNATDDDRPISIVLEGHGAFLPDGPTVENRSDYAAKQVSAGRFTVTEALPPGWQLSTIDLTGDGCVEVVPNGVFEAISFTLSRAIEWLTGETSITFDAAPGADCHVTFSNERLVATIVVEKLYLGAPGEAPTLAVEVDGAAAAGDWIATGSPISRWEKVVAVAATGSTATVTETLPAGWANVRAIAGSCESADTTGAPFAGATASVSIETIAPGDTATVCFVNVAVGRVQLVKLETVDSGVADSWTFTSSSPGVGGGLQTAHSDGVEQVQALFSLVPVGEYTIAETGGRAACVPGALASDFETRAAASVGTPPADDEMSSVVANGNAPFAVEKGQTTYIRFDNVGCGTVLGTGTIVVWKFADYDGDGIRDPGEPPVANWPFSITGPDGEFRVTTDSEGKHVFTVAKGGIYKVSESPTPVWRTIGSFQPGANLVTGGVAQVAAGLGQQREVTFLNQPLVSIRVQKTEVLSSAPAGRPGVGWEFTVTGCGITARTAVTGSDGSVTVADLPAAVGCTYTVTETLRAGWAAVNASRTAAPTAAGETALLSFRNILIETCLNCAQPAAPASPEEPPPPTATSTAISGTATPTPSVTASVTPTFPDGGTGMTAVAGERTPGPAPTPLPPTTGASPAGGGSSALALWLLGSATVATGFMVFRLGRRR